MSHQLVLHLKVVLALFRWYISWIRYVFLYLGSPDGASASPPPERQQGSYFWVKRCPSLTPSPCIIQSGGHKEHRVLCSAWGTQVFMFVRYSVREAFVCLAQISLLCCLTGKCGMYFVEDNAADAHDNQVKPEDRWGLFFATGCHCIMWVSLATQHRLCLCVWTEPSWRDRGTFFLLDLRGDQGGAQALVAAKRQRCRDIPHQRQNSVVSLWQHQGEARRQVTLSECCSWMTYKDVLVCFTSAVLFNYRKGLGWLIHN